MSTTINSPEDSYAAGYDHTKLALVNHKPTFANCIRQMALLFKSHFSVAKIREYKNFDKNRFKSEYMFGCYDAYGDYAFELGIKHGSVDRLF